MYIEASRPRALNDAAFLQTYLMPSSAYCLDINYNMYGVSTKFVDLQLVKGLN